MNRVVIFAYTRQQALEDGVLVDASTLAKEAGFKWPVALTHAAWVTCVEVPEGVEAQDETGRLWDVLNVLFFTIRRSPQTGTVVRFCVSVRNSRPEDVPLKCVCGPDDDGNPCLTIMLPDED